MFSKVFRLLVLSLSVMLPLSVSAETLSLRNNLSKASPGDYVVAAQNKTFTLLHIYGKAENALKIEEITIPSLAKLQTSWKEWVRQGAPGNTSWRVYTLNILNGEIQGGLVRSRHGWQAAPMGETFLPTLLDLNFTKIPERERRKVGASAIFGDNEGRGLWQPPMVVEGETIPGVTFDAWRTQWPRDASVLSGKSIEIYLPKESDQYPSFFPVWLQVGVAGKAQMRVVDSGSGLESPIPKP